MTRLFAAVTLTAILGGTAVASEPVARSTAQKSAPRIKVTSNPILQAMATDEARDRDTIRDVCELLTPPQPHIVRFVRNGCLLVDEVIPLPVWAPIQPKQLHERLIEFVACPSVTILEYLGAQVRDRLAREEMHRFSTNNQPQVFTYERLYGAIGP